MMKVTDEQVLESIRKLTHSMGYPPTLREIAADLGLASFSSIARRIDGLEVKGMLVRKPGVSRGIKLTDAD